MKCALNIVLVEPTSFALSSAAVSSSSSVGSRNSATANPAQHTKKRTKFEWTYTRADHINEGTHVAKQALTPARSVMLSQNPPIFCRIIIPQSRARRECLILAGWNAVINMQNIKQNICDLDYKWYKFNTKKNICYQHDSHFSRCFLIYYKLIIVYVKNKYGR